MGQGAGSRVGTGRFQAMGQLDSTCAAPAVDQCSCPSSTLSFPNLSADSFAALVMEPGVILHGVAVRVAFESKFGNQKIIPQCPRVHISVYVCTSVATRRVHQCIHVSTYVSVSTHAHQCLRMYRSLYACTACPQWTSVLQVQGLQPGGFKLRVGSTGFHFCTAPTTDTRRTWWRSAPPTLWAKDTL
jgi:hypothetical protein